MATSKYHDKCIDTTYKLRVDLTGTLWDLFVPFL